jgi:hypothetical protein
MPALIRQRRHAPAATADRRRVEQEAMTTTTKLITQLEATRDETMEKVASHNEHHLAHIRSALNRR